MSYDGTIKIDTSIDSSGIKKGVSGITSSIKSIASALGIVKLVESAFSLLRSSIQSAFERSDTMEQFNRTISAITGDSQAAGAALEELKRITKGTAYGLDVAAKAVQNFVTRGMSLEDATKQVSIWADAVSFYGNGTNEELQTVTDALAKMSTKGKVEMEQLNRLFDVGIDAVGMYAKATGRSAEEVQDDLSYGRINTEEFIAVVSEAMETGAGGVQKVAGAAKEAGASWQGTMDNMKAAATRGMLDIINAIDEGLKSVNLPSLREAVAGFGSFMESALSKVAGSIKRIFQDWGTFIKSELLEPLTSGGIKNGIQMLGYLFKTLGAMIGKLVNIISKLVKTILPLFSKCIKVIGDNLTWLLPLVTSVYAGLKAWAVVQTVTKNLQMMTKAIATAISATKLQIIGIKKATLATAEEAAAAVASTTAISLKQLAIGVLTGKIRLVTAAQWLWNAAMSANPTRLVVVAVAALTAGIASLDLITRATGQNVKNTFENAGKAAADFYSGIETSKSYLDQFNDTLFISSQKQQELTASMESVQNGITEICHRASAERRDYTAKEIEQLDAYFEKLRGLYAQQLEVEQARTQAIAQQATTQAETFEGSLEEYKITAQEWINTAQQQAEQETSLIQEQTTTQLSLLNERYGAQASMENEAYANEYNAIMANQQAQTDAVNQGIGKITAAYAEGYAQRANLSGLEKQRVGADNASIESESQRHADQIAAIESDSGLTSQQQQELIQAENQRHRSNMASIWAALTQDMSEEQQNQLGVYLGLVAQTELYGGELDRDTAETAQAIVDNFAAMPKGTRQAMGDAMSPMLDEMEKARPGLFAKAMDIGNGIISTLKKAFDEHSPSKKTREIARYLWAGFELETDKSEPALYQKTKSAGQNILKALQDTISGGNHIGNVPLSVGVDLSGINTADVLSQMQEAVLKNRAQVMAKISATTQASMISKLDSMNLIKEIKNACKEGCESASLQAEVNGTVIMGRRQVGTLVAPYVSEELGKVGVYG